MTRFTFDYMSINLKKKKKDQTVIIKGKSNDTGVQQKDITVALVRRRTWVYGKDVSAHTDSLKQLVNVQVKPVLWVAVIVVVWRRQPIQRYNPGQTEDG